MRNKIYYLLLSVPALLFSSNLFAQMSDNEQTGMRSNGKIYVVLAVCITILAGLLLYVVSIDRKIGKIEKENG
ncbi:CcmD family protein [Ferruginibacter paludis]|uniref:CcmD family protein n=1 Tax=Ferruginibacter paludis TaxID=1310417 RepID=UPI0025B433C4|nr:CcmD family protein [Ferruginibacter paludis]MDN3658751.1 CcmD family protein [Ferruginibacter paludis]